MPKQFEVEVTGWDADNVPIVWTGRGATEDEAVEDAKHRGGIVEVGDVTVYQAATYAIERCGRSGCAHNGSCGYGAP